MSISSDLFQALEDAINRLATESILAQAGRDDGLVPCFSLLGDLRNLCDGQTALRDPIVELHARFEANLTDARPFSDDLIRHLRALIDWLSIAIARVKAGNPVPAFSTVPAHTPSPLAGPLAAGVTPKASATPADEVLTLNLGENRELLAEFHSEAVEHLQQIEAALLVLDHDPDDPEALNALFRSFHTFKGNAGFLGLVPMQALAHEVESLLDLARDHKLRLTAPIVTAILQSRDALQRLTEQVGSALGENRLPAEIVPVRDLIDLVKRLVRGGDIDLGDGGPVTTAGSSPNASSSEPVASQNPKATNSTVRVNVDKLDSLMDVVGELVIVQGQLLETAHRLGGDPASPMQRNFAQLHRITKELQRTALGLRMIPIKPAFQKMERLARDLAGELGKKFHLVTEGDETELDRTVIEEIADPLVHMVRNALDHGLETPAERIAAGKPESGTLVLRAYHQGSTIVIELKDDGRGIDPERIFRKAVERGLVAAQAVLTPREILMLLMAPGFSTAEKITAVSGRGVGLDVVKRNIEHLRGSIEIESEVGRGSTFTIKLPLTMAIIDGLVVRVGTERFILPSSSVQRALRPGRELVSTVQGRGELLDLHGRLIPIHRLHRRFGIPHDAAQPWDGIVVIVEHGGKISALLVDEMISKQEVVIKNLGAFMRNLPGVAGGAILGDGAIALILDPTSLLQAA